MLSITDRRDFLKNSEILVYIVRFLYPFVLLFGCYIIVNGDLSPGGGFQGGAVLATAFLITNFINSEKTINLTNLVKIEKYLFISIVIVASISFITKGELFTNFIIDNENISFKRIFLLLLNILIGLKVSAGFIAVFSTFIEEEK